MEFNAREVRARIEKASKKATFIGSTQALKDSNLFIKKDAGILEASSIKASELDKGLLVWDTPYAKLQYYTGDPSKEVNPKASKMWAHKAASQYGREWKDLMQKMIDKGV